MPRWVNQIILWGSIDLRTTPRNNINKLMDILILSLYKDYLRT